MIKIGSNNFKYPSTFLRTKKSIIKDIDNLLLAIRKNITKGINLGCGSTKIPYLINCDFNNKNADRKVDAKNLSIFGDGSLDLIEVHHLIEHLSFSDTDIALKEWRRTLKSKGFLIITCPNLTKICLNWLKYTIFYPILPRPNRLDYIVKMLVGSQEHKGMFHKNAFNIIRLQRILQEYGFNKEFSYSPYPLRRTPSLIMIAKKK